VLRVSDLTAPDDRQLSDIAAPGGQSELAYIRVADDITARIASRELVSGTRLRAERELAAHFGVAYGTMRHAMQLLRERGLIVTIHGRGTFVA
jgi:DNA-binding GntR family transcriptional regulator